jgi:hypothetical protein
MAKRAAVNTSKAAKAKPSTVPDLETDEDAEGEEEPPEEKVEFDGGLDPRRWNKHEAFSQFLARFAAAQPLDHLASSQTEVGDVTNTEGDDNAESPMRIQVSARSSRSSSFSFASSDGIEDGEHAEDSKLWISSSPFRLPIVTPAPVHALARARIEKAGRKLRQMAATVMEEDEKEEKDRERRRKVRELAKRKQIEKELEQKESVKPTAQEREENLEDEDEGEEAGEEEGEGQSEIAVAEDWDPFYVDEEDDAA